MGLIGDYILQVALFGSCAFSYAADEQSSCHSLIIPFNYNEYHCANSDEQAATDLLMRQGICQSRSLTDLEHYTNYLKTLGYRHKKLDIVEFPDACTLIIYHAVRSILFHKNRIEEKIGQCSDFSSIKQLLEQHRNHLICCSPEFVVDIQLFIHGNK